MGLAAAGAARGRRLGPLVPRLAVPDHDAEPRAVLEARGEGHRQRHLTGGADERPHPAVGRREGAEKVARAVHLGMARVVADELVGLFELLELDPGAGRQRTRRNHQPPGVTRLSPAAARRQLVGERIGDGDEPQVVQQVVGRLRAGLEARRGHHRTAAGQVVIHGRPGVRQQDLGCGRRLGLERLPHRDVQVVGVGRVAIGGADRPVEAAAGVDAVGHREDLVVFGVARQVLAARRDGAPLAMREPFAPVVDLDAGERVPRQRQADLLLHDAVGMQADALVIAAETDERIGVGVRRTAGPPLENQDRAGVGGERQRVVPDVEEGLREPAVRIVGVAPRPVGGAAVIGEHQHVAGYGGRRPLLRRGEARPREIAEIQVGGEPGEGLEDRHGIDHQPGLVEGAQLEGRSGCERREDVAGADVDRRVAGMERVELRDVAAEELRVDERVDGRLHGGPGDAAHDEPARRRARRRMLGALERRDLLRGEDLLHAAEGRSPDLEDEIARQQAPRAELFLAELDETGPARLLFGAEREVVRGLPEQAVHGRAQVVGRREHHLHVVRRVAVRVRIGPAEVEGDRVAVGERLGVEGRARAAAEQGDEPIDDAELAHGASTVSASAGLSVTRSRGSITRM